MKVAKLIFYLFIALVFFFLFWNIFQNWETVKSFPWHISAFDGLLIAVLVLLLFPINSFSWHLVTCAIGLNVSFDKNLQVWMFSNAARLLPGGFWQYPGRIYLSGKLGVSKMMATTAVVIEALLVMSVGALLILLSFFFWHLPTKIIEAKFLLFVLIPLPLILSTLSSQRIATFFAKLIMRVSRREGIVGKIRLPFRWIPVLSFFFFLQFLLPSIFLFLLSKSVIELSLAMFPVFLGIFATSWLLGYLVFFAPSGLGVQEASVAGLLSFYMPLPIASIIAILLRIFLFVSEGLFLTFILWRYGRKGFFFATTR